MSGLDPFAYSLGKGSAKLHIVKSRKEWLEGAALDGGAARTSAVYACGNSAANVATLRFVEEARGLGLSRCERCWGQARGVHRPYDWQVSSA